MLNEAASPTTTRRSSIFAKWKSYLGPGLITGASDDDPSGIATYAQAGALYGYQLSWIMLFTYPLMSAIQQLSGRIGRVTGKGIAANLRDNYPPSIVYAVLLLLCAANIINIAADLGAMAAALKLLVPGPQVVYVGLFGATCVILQCTTTYDRYVSVLKWLTLSLLAYVLTLFVVKLSWSSILHSLFIPSIHDSRTAVMMVVAILGTTISPYLFFWQANSEVENVNVTPELEPLAKTPKQGPEEIKRITIDTNVGMAVSNLVALCIMIATAATLHVQGITEINSAQQAAEALRPVAGSLAFVLFSLGIIGTGFLAVPVLSGSASYALGELLHWRVGFIHDARRAKRFYAAIATATLIGVIINWLPINPFKALVYSAVINGVAAVPIMVMIVLISRKKNIMGQFVSSSLMQVLGWLATFVMAVAAAFMLMP